MKTTNEEKKRAERLLHSKNVQIHAIQEFSFMKRYRAPRGKSSPTSKDKYGPGILTFHLKNGKDKAIYLSPSQHPTAMIHYLLFQEIPFSNYTPRSRTAETIPSNLYCRPSLYMFYFIILSLIFAVSGCRMVVTGIWWGIIPGILTLILSGLLLYALLSRFCYLSMDNKNLTVHCLGKAISYPYSRLRKINFDYAREQVFTHTMEILDENYNYHLYYIGRVPRTKLEELTRYLQQAGVDATCSLDQDKRYYQDNYKKH